jgi:hypothetical protein
LKGAGAAGALQELPSRGTFVPLVIPHRVLSLSLRVRADERQGHEHRAAHPDRCERVYA